MKKKIKLRGIKMALPWLVKNEREMRRKAFRRFGAYEKGNSIKLTLRLYA